MPFAAKSELRRKKALNAIRAVGLIVPALLLSNCGDAPGDGTASPPNASPSFTSPATATIAEDQSFAYKATATDPENDPLTYSIAGGADAAAFRIDSAGNLAFVNQPNFEAPADAGVDNVYDVRLAVSDGHSTIPLDLKVTVQDSKEGVTVERVGTGFNSIVSIAARQDELYVAQSNGSVYRLDPNTGSKTLWQQNLPDLAPNGLVSWSVPEWAFSPTYFVRAVYVNTSNQLVLRVFSGGPIGGVQSCDKVLASNIAPGDVSGLVAYIESLPGLWLALSDAPQGQPSQAQDSSSYLGKLMLVDSGTSASPCASLRLFASGLHDPRSITYAPTTVSSETGFLITDRGQSLFDEINYLSLFDYFLYGTNTALNYGWPFKEGTSVIAGTPPADLSDPRGGYARGTGPKMGAGIVGGQVYKGANASLKDKLVFADQNGAIFTQRFVDFQAGVAPSSWYEIRTPDFAPDIGSLAHPKLFAQGVGSMRPMYIATQEGDIFRVR